MTGGDPGATRHSPLTQITKDNVARLDQAWSFDTGANNLQVTPIVVGGVMYLTAASTVFAIEPETGKELWRFAAPGKVSRRGVAYWPGDGTRQPRLYSGIEGGRLVALDARTGEPLTEFGKSGFVDLKAGLGDVEGAFMLDSPAAVYKNVLITGGSNSEGEPSRGLYGDIRGWDARDGRLLWTFHTVPRAGEKGVETWDGESWRNRSGVNAWTYITVDAERGLVFAATGAPDLGFLRRRSPRRQPLRQQRRRARCRHRRAEMVPPAGAPRSVGLGPAGAAGPDRGRAQRPPHTSRRPDDEDEPGVRLRPRHRRADLRPRGASGAAERGAWGGRLADAAVSSSPRAAVANVVRPGARHVQPDARARRLLPRSLGEAQHGGCADLLAARA